MWIYIYGYIRQISCSSLLESVVSKNSDGQSPKHRLLRLNKYYLGVRDFKKNLCQEEWLENLQTKYCSI